MTAKALYKADPSAKVAAWIKQLAKAGNQGPFGQAHFVESVFPPERGGARKAPEDAPYLNDWCCIAAGSFVTWSLIRSLVQTSHSTRASGSTPDSRISIPRQGS